METYIALGVVFACAFTIALVMIVAFQEMRRYTPPEPEPEVNLSAPGKLSGYMAVPRKRPALRTRHTKSL